MRDIINKDCKSEDKRKEKIYAKMVALITLFLVGMVVLTAGDINWVVQDKQIRRHKLQADNHSKSTGGNGSKR